jgi:hypothetical protein
MEHNQLVPVRGRRRANGDTYEINGYKAASANYLGQPERERGGGE